MKINIQSIAIICILLLLSGCVAYTPPYQQYGYGSSMSPYGMQPQVAPYGGYNYGYTPVIPAPHFGFGGGWGHGGWGGHRGYGGFRHH